MALEDATIEYVAELAFIVFPILLFSLAFLLKWLDWAIFKKKTGGDKDE